MTHLWKSDSFIDDNTLTVNVTRLRKKLEDIELKDFIRTKKSRIHYEYGIFFYLKPRLEFSIPVLYRKSTSAPSVKSTKLPRKSLLI